MTPELKPCPFCGGEPHYAKAYDRVDCTSNKCQMSVRGQMSPEQWNRRTPDLTEALARLKALEERMGDEKIDVIEIWHNDGIGGMTKTNAIAELSAQRKEWADEIAAIRKAMGGGEATQSTEGGERG